MNCILPLRRWRVQRCDTCRYIPKRTHSNSVCQVYKYQTRMHSSRMRTARTSNRVGGGGCLPQCMLGYPPVWEWRPARHAGIPPPPLETCCKECWDTIPTPSHPNPNPCEQNHRCCNMDQNDTIGKIELNPLSSCQVIILIARMTFNCSTSCLMS